MESRKTRTEDETLSPSREGVPGILWVYPEEKFTPFVDGMLTLGRDAAATVCLKSRSVSRIHASIHRQGAVHVLGDRGSHNGTYCNGKRIDQHPISLGDVIRMGSWVGIALSSPKDCLTTNTFLTERDSRIVVGPRSRDAWLLIEKFAPTEAPILLQGETGTGKEVFARAIHQLSERQGPFVAQNCGALPDSLAEAHLFGHAKGAFTGATQSSMGLFRAAEGGTLLLDEVADLPYEQQVKLLRVLEDKVVVPVGQTQGRPVDVRFISAGQEDLEQAVFSEDFRGDLLARLAGVTVVLLPLRERREEIPRLFHQFYSGSARPRASFIEALLLHDWPRNIRELKTLAARATIEFGELEGLGRSHFLMLTAVTRRKGEKSPDDTPHFPANQERIHSETWASVLGHRRASWLLRHLKLLEELQVALLEHGGNVSSAAKKVGISRQKAQRLLSSADEIKKSTTNRSA